MLSSNNLARGVAVVSSDITETDLKRLDTAGVRAVRFNFVKRLVENTPREVFQIIAQKIATLGWHIVVYLEAQDLEELIPFLRSLPTDIVFDHMARPDISKGTNSKEFNLFRKLMENEKFWCKTSCPERLSKSGPKTNYADVKPFMKLLIENYSERVLWGTDWPHPNMKSHMPDDGNLVDVLQDIAVKPEFQKKLLVDNPSRLYWSN